jgi:hypothetical protein
VFAAIGKLKRVVELCAGRIADEDALPRFHCGCGLRCCRGELRRGDGTQRGYIDGSLSGLLRSAGPTEESPFLALGPVGEDADAELPAGFIRADLQGVALIFAVD